MIDHVRQRGPFDCGVAVASMLACRPYDYTRLVVEESPFVYLTKSRGLSGRSPATLLTNITNVAWARRHSLNHGPFGLARYSRFAALVVPNGTDKKVAGHWIAVEHDLMFDPELTGPVRIKEYDRIIGHTVEAVVVLGRE